MAIDPLLFTVLEGIFSGELQHKQTEFHCGTSHCVAGWIQVLYVKKVYGDEYFDFNSVPANSRFESYDTWKKNYFSEYVDGVSRFAYDDWNIAQALVSLTYAEASLLFSTEATLAIQKSVYKYLKAGNRITEAEYYTYGEFENGENYEGDFILTEDLDFLEFMEKEGYRCDRQFHYVYF